MLPGSVTYPLGRLDDCAGAEMPLELGLLQIQCRFFGTHSLRRNPDIRRIIRGSTRP